LILDIVGACLTWQEVDEHYPDMQLRGSTADFGADFSIQQAGGEALNQTAIVCGILQYNANN